MPLLSLKQWNEDQKTLGVVCDHSQAKPVERKHKIKKSRQAAFKTALEDRTKPSEQLHYTEAKTSDSLSDQEKGGIQAHKRDEAPSQRRKENHHMIQIFIKTPIIDPKNLCLRLNHNTTISSLKKLIHKKLGTPPALQILHAGRLQFKSCDALTLLDLAIQPETNITLSLASGLLGGAPKPRRTVDETLLRNLAGNLGTDWQRLAIILRFTSAEIGKFESHDENPPKQAFQMLDSWWKNQPLPEEAGEWLRCALIQTERRDLASQIPRGYVGLPESPRVDDMDEVHSRQSPEHQSPSSDTSGIDEKMLRVLAENIGKDWRRLATSLGFSAAKIETFELNHKNDLEESVFHMFLTFARKKTNQMEITDGLTKAFEELDRKDMINIIKNVKGRSFNIEACGETLVSHYKEKMKVDTHPTEKDLAVDMDKLFVSLELLQEANNLDQPIKLQTEATKEKQSDTKAKENKFPQSTLHPDLKDEFEVGHNPNRVPLKSYKDMLRLDKKRMLITAESGYGKSTLLKKIAYDWAVLRSDTRLTRQKQDSPLSKYQLVFLLEINKMEANFNIMDEIFFHLLPANEFGKDDLKDYITQNPDEVLILLDGADEISFQKLQSATEYFSVHNVLSFKSLKRCKAIVTSRQSTALKLLKCNAEYTRINIAGFNDNSKQEYIRKYFNTSDIKHHLSEINKSETLRSLSEIPLFLWLMCSSLKSHSERLPDTITELFDLAIGVFYWQKISKDCTSKPRETLTEERFNELMSKLGQVALERLMLESDEKHFLAVTAFDSEVYKLGCEVGLLTPFKLMQGINRLERVKFYHLTIMQYCCSVYLSDLVETSPDKFNEYLLKLLDGDVERNGYLIRFCSGRNQKAAEYVIELTKQQLTAYNKKPTAECERYVCLHRLMMFALFESKRTLVLDEWVRFPYELKGEDLLAAHYFIQKLPRQPRLVLDDMTITCQSETDLKLLETIMVRTVCKLSLQIVRVNMEDQLNILKLISKRLKSLTLEDCQLTYISVPQLSKLMKSATELKTVDLSGNNLHGLKSDQIPPITSLKLLKLNRCKLESGDIGPLFSLVAAVGSIQNVWLNNNNLHGIQGDQIAPVSSLEGLSLSECSLQCEDIGPVFSLVAAAGSVKRLFLHNNNLHGIQEDQITPVSALKELSLSECSLQFDDIGPVFSFIAASGNVKTVWLNTNNLNGIQGKNITPVSSLEELYLSQCSLQCDDIGPVFSLIAAAGSVKTVWLNKNNLNGIQGDQVTPNSSLEELYLSECSLQCGDVGPVFSLVAAAAGIKRVWLDENNLHGIQGGQKTPVSSLEELSLLECSLQCGDIGSVFSHVAAAGSIKTVLLDKNNLHGIQGDQITHVSSLEELSLMECSLQCDDIGPVFALVAAAGSIKTVWIDTNNLHGIQGDRITPVSSLEELSLMECSLQCSDIGPVFSLVAAAGSVNTVSLDKNNLHGIQGDQITPVSSLEGLSLSECSLQCGDIRPVFSLVAAAGSIKKFWLNNNCLHNIQGDQITGISSLEELYLSECSLQCDDIGPVFSLVADAGRIKKFWLNNNNLHNIQGDQITGISSLEELYLSDCSLQCGDIGPVFSLVAAAGSIKTVWLDENNLHGIQGDRIKPISSLEVLYLMNCGLHDDERRTVSSSLNMEIFRFGLCRL